MSLGCYQTIQFPRNGKSGFLSCSPLKISPLKGNKIGSVKFRKFQVSQRRKDITMRLKSMLGVDSVVEIQGKEGVSTGSKYDAIVIGSGIGGLVAATQLAVKGAKVLVLEKYVIPGGSSGYYQRDGYTFDVGSSVMFGFSDKVSFFLSLVVSSALWHCLLAFE